MSTLARPATRVAAYGAGLVVLVAGGYLLGDRTNHGNTTPATPGHSTHATTSKTNSPTDAGGEGDDMSGMGGMDMASDSSSLPQGVSVTTAGYTLSLPVTGYTVGKQKISFQIIGPDGKPVTSYEKSHEQDLHLIAVRRDFAGFQHVHPVLDTETGTWAVDLDLQPGTWRVFTDFVPATGTGAGADLVLGTDLLVPGNPGAQALPTPQRVSHVDGYTVTLNGDLTAGQHSMLDFKVTKDGAPVTTLQPYLGAFGHLVALREGDQAYLHVHPGGEPGDGVTKPGPDIDFGAEVPSAARYHLFLDFQVDGVVHTASFTLDASRGDGSAGDATDHDDMGDMNGGESGSTSHSH